MKHWLVRVAMLLVLALASLEGVAQDKVIRLTSLEWPPYSGAKVTGQGANIAVVRAAVEAMGYRLEVKFLPWSRAVATARDARSGYVGYLPEYYSPRVARDFILSDPIGSGPIGFVEAVAAPVAWTRLSDLGDKRIGVVTDYVNTPQFDAMVAAGTLKVEAVGDDAANIKKVATGRIPMAVIDRNVLAYLLQHDPALAAVRSRVQFNVRTMGENKLYVALQRSPQGQAAAAVINAGLKRVDAAAIAARYF